MKKYLIIFALLIITGCEQNIKIANSNITMQASTNINKKVYQETWQELEAGLRFKEIPIYRENTNNENVLEIISIFKFQPDKFNFSIKQQTEEPLAVSEWQEKYQPLFVCNGGYFLENNQAAELLKINSQKYGTYLTSESAGEFIIDDNGQPDIVINASYETINNVLQSYPLLVRPDGQTSIEEDSGQTAPRSVIAKDKDGDILFIFTQNYYFSLYKLQNYLQASDLNLKIALNLDGGPSSGFYLNSSDKKIFESAKVPNVIMLFRQ